MPSKSLSLLLYVSAVCMIATPAGLAAEICTGFGPQTPRDIHSRTGTNPNNFSRAPRPSRLNLCNIHAHTNAEHKGPGFSIFAGNGKFGGYACNDKNKLSDAELKPAPGAFKGAQPGDTIEVHWVYSSCNVKPANGLKACLSDACANPQLRVEAQVFLLVNDPDALDFQQFTVAEQTNKHNKFQPKKLPSRTGRPVVFAGSTTGPSYTEAKCSPLQVTWSVRPKCAKLDIHSLHQWASDNPFEEDHAQGVRQLVTAPELLAPIRRR